MLATQVRRKNLLWVLFAVLLVMSSIAVMAGSSDQFAVQEGLSLKAVGTFEEGVDTAWNYSQGQFAPRYWTTSGPTYSYTPGTTGNVMATTDWDPDNINYWDVFGNSNGVQGYTGYADLDYQLFIPTSGRIFSWESWTSNYQNWNGYTKLQLKWYGWNSNPNVNVILNVYVYTQANGGQWIALTPSPWLSRSQNTIYTEEFDISGLTSTQLSQISYIKFRVANNYITAGTGANAGRQRTHLFSVKLTTSNVPSASITIGPNTVDSKFLGTVLHKRFGSYSATGFYDTGMSTPGKFKIWFGGGIPEKDSGDNVWYVETTTLDQSVLKDYDLKATRCTLTPTNILDTINGVNWCWGDPTVVRFMSSWNPPACVYYMYFSGLAAGTTWNQVYRAYSYDGINWTINPSTPVVAAANGGVAGYGSGAPSVVITSSGQYYLYYYSQYESAGPGEYLRIGDGVNFGAPTKCVNVNSAIDAKYIDSMGLWACVSDIGVQGAGCYTMLSSDGVTWVGGAPPYLAQDPSMYICHNPGFIGTDQGHGWPDMYVTYGASQEAVNPTEYYTRELEYSSWHIWQ
ncbi:MAG: hypothetical protein ACYC64_02625 [Armatimonadota bacterium]